MVAVLEFFNDRCRTDAHIRTDEPNCSDHHSTEDHALSISKKRYCSMHSRSLVGGFFYDSITTCLIRTLKTNWMSCNL